MAYKRPTQEVVCEECKTPFQKENRNINQTIKRNGGKHFCSRKCSTKYSAREQFKDVTEFNTYFNVARTRAKQRGMEFDLTIEFLTDLYENTQKGKCAITGVPMILPTRKHIQYDEKSMYAASLDRLDNSKGYTKDNVQFTLLGINYMRNTFTLDETVEFLATVTKELHEHL